MTIPKPKHLGPEYADQFRDPLDGRVRCCKEIYTVVATALINGRIIDGNGGPPVENGALLIVDNLMGSEAVGTDVDIPPDARMPRSSTFRARVSCPA